MNQILDTVRQRTENLDESFGVIGNPTGVQRLSPATRALARRYLAGEFGLPMQEADFGCSPEESAGLSNDLHYARVVELIANQTPIRIEPEELLIGNAPLLEATHHQLPASPFRSISHTTIGFDVGLKIGYTGIRECVAKRLDQAEAEDDRAGIDFLQAVQVCLDAAATWHERCIAALEQQLATADNAQRKHCQGILNHARRVPEAPPQNFREAVQALWFMWEFQRLCGNWSGLGRLDLMLGPYLQQDLNADAIDLDQARELLAHFWIKGCEWIGANNFAAGSGDAQFYQNVVLGGVDADGQPVLNNVTWLILDIAEELHISDFPVAVRLNRETPTPLLQRVAAVQARGGGIVSIYNDDVLLPALTDFGYDLAEARNYANDGCWEPIIPGKTCFGYAPFDALQLLQETMGLNEKQPPVYDDFETLYAAFRERLDRFLTDLHSSLDEAHCSDQPAPLLSMLVDGCIERARGYEQRGPTYVVTAPHAGGLPDTANSLLVLKQLVFDQEQLPYPEFVRILQDDWNGHEDLRLAIRKRFTMYGNDAPAADAMLQRVYDDYVELAGRVANRNGVLRPPGISTFGREIAFREHRLATPHGARRGEILATNFAPTPGTDVSGPTAVIKSFCSVDYRKLPNCCPLELKLHPACVNGATGSRTLVSLLKTFLQLGGLYLQVDVIDTDVLRDAQKHPDRYPNLSVRISGWSARFATLNRDWQDMIIQRTEQTVGR